MADEKDEKQSKFSHLSPQQAEYAEKSVAKLTAIKAVRQMSDPDSDWTLLQEIMQEIVAGHMLKSATEVPETPALIDQLKTEVKLRYDLDPEMRDILLEAIPNPKSARAWFKKKGWNEAVWAKIRDGGLFTKQRRAKMIDSLYQRGIDKSDVAAKIWLTLSGDYQEKMEVNEKSVDTFREINKVLNKKDK